MRDMKLFGKKKKVISDKSEEYVLKEGLETEVENIQYEFRTKQEELNDITKKNLAVKEEYNSTINNLMQVKKELNQVKMGLDATQRENREITEKIKNYEKIKDSKFVNEFNETKGNLSKIKQELEEVTKEYDRIKEQVGQEQSALHSIRKQQI